MAKEAKLGGRSGLPWRVIGWGIAAALMIFPIVTRAPWTAEDFVFAGVVLGTIGLGAELATRFTRSIPYRAGVAAALVAAAMIVVVNGAVGMIGDEGNAYNELFLGVIAVALLGAILTRFRARGMAIAMVAAAGTQAVVGLLGLSADPRGAVLSAALAGIWLLPAAFFRAAAREQAQGPR